MTSSHRARTAPNAQSAVDLDDSSLYINRHLSWLKFNGRVLCEALDARRPLLERVKFLAIFASNLDEFFMIRVSHLHRKLVTGITDPSQDGMSPTEQMAAIRYEVLQQQALASRCWHEDLRPKLQHTGICVLQYAVLSEAQQAQMRAYFAREIFPVLTPLAFDPGHPFPHISNLSLNLAVVVTDSLQRERFARIKVPSVFPRLLQVCEESLADDGGYCSLTDRAQGTFVWLEEVIAANLDLLFTGLEIAAAYPFRVTRDADLDYDEDEAADLLLTIEEQVELRDFGSEIRLEIDTTMPAHVRDLLATNLRIAPYQVYTLDMPLGQADLMGLTRIDRRDLKDPPFVPSMPPALQSEGSLFSAIRQRNILIYHPYHSFAPVVDFVREAARDPQVLAIKQTLYRLGKNSPIIDALMEARENDKQVAVLVELKARFDEENNIAWARALEQAGVHVVYGLLGLKTHAKMCLVVRRDPDGIRRYVHLGTGNYNPLTGRLYADLSYFTCDPEIGHDATDLFNALTGYSHRDAYRKLLVAPGAMRRQIIARIEREIDRHRDRGDGYLAFKMNSLVDPACIQALYRASQAGVNIDLQVRGICCLRPGIPGISEHITVTSIVGRFLEHARIYYFRNGGDEEILLGSADLMQRNLDRRVEALFPVEDTRLRRVIVDEILFVHLRDNAHCARLCSDGSYVRLPVDANEAVLDSQRWMLEHAARME